MPRHTLSRSFSGLLIALLLVARLAPAETKVSHQRERWLLDNAALQVTVDTASGTWSVKDKTSSRQWQQASAKAHPERFHNVREVPAQGIVFDADFLSPGKGPVRMTVTITLDAKRPDVRIEGDLPDRQTAFSSVQFLEPLVLDSADAAIVVADYCDGHLYPADLNPLPSGGWPFPRNVWIASRLDMPWIGLCDVKSGEGYMIILESSDDASIEARHVKVGSRELVAPAVTWSGSKGKFAYPRKLIYHFVPKGGYVALAKRYRAYAAEHGLIVPFTEKLKKNPNLRRLFGAPDVWGDGSLKMAQEARQAGVEKMLIHGRSSSEDMKAINDLGYLTSEYDNYTDILPPAPGKELDSHHDQIPESVVLKADGQRMAAWLTFDKKTQYMKRCPALWVRSAQVVIPKVLQTHPFLGRFIDVTTAEDLYECYDPKHPLTKGDKRQCGVDLLSYVRSQHLVVGGEHGIWWAVPELDYIEGMMSGNPYFSWPAGHLIHPKTKDQEFTSPQGHKLGKWEAYERFGIGHQFRVPLWELVFHDCVVSTWYWGDASDFLLDAAPEITPKKDAFNILYGTIPLLWVNKEGAWHKDREVFLRTYRNTCKFHEAIATAEMTGHEFVTEDRAVQRTRFSDGTEVIVNFGSQPYTAQLAGKSHVLPQNGFAVKGPKIEQSLTLEDGRPVTTIRTPTFEHRE